MLLRLLLPEELEEVEELSPILFLLLLFFPLATILMLAEVVEVLLPFC